MHLVCVGSQGSHFFLLLSVLWLCLAPWPYTLGAWVAMARTVNLIERVAQMGFALLAMNNNCYTLVHSKTFRCCPGLNHGPCRLDIGCHYPPIFSTYLQLLVGVCIALLARALGVQNLYLFDTVQFRHLSVSFASVQPLPVTLAVSLARCAGRYPHGSLCTVVIGFVLLCRFEIGNHYPYGFSAQWVLRCAKSIRHCLRLSRKPCHLEIVGSYLYDSCITVWAVFTLSGRDQIRP